MHRPEPSRSIETQTRAMFTRVLSGWALDLLELRRSGLIVPSAREGSLDPVMPDWGRENEPRVLRGPNWAAPVDLRWQPTRKAA